MARWRMPYHQRWRNGVALCVLVPETPFSLNTGSGEVSSANCLGKHIAAAWEVEALIGLDDEPKPAKAHNPQNPRPAKNAHRKRVVSI